MADRPILPTTSAHEVASTSLRRFAAGSSSASPPAAASASSLALAQSRAPRPEPYALRGVRLSLEDDATSTLILRDGVIESILDAQAAVPAGCRHVDGEGLIAMPAFVDAYTTSGCDTLRSSQTSRSTTPITKADMEAR